MKSLPDSLPGPAIDKSTIRMDSTLRQKNALAYLRRVETKKGAARVRREVLAERAGFAAIALAGLAFTVSAFLA